MLDSTKLQLYKKLDNDIGQVFLFKSNLYTIMRQQWNTNHVCRFPTHMFNLFTTATYPKGVIAKSKEVAPQKGVGDFSPIFWVGEGGD